MGTSAWHTTVERYHRSYEQECLRLHRSRPLKVRPIKGVVNRVVTFEEFVELLYQEARLRNTAPRALAG
jgi:hypothetical protein